MAAGLPWTGLIAVAAGAVFGAWLRWGLGTLLNARVPIWPLGTLVANLAGGYAIGVVIAWLDLRHDLPPEWRLFLVTGFLGALTTFSTFSAEVVALLQRDELAHAAALASVHVFGSLALTFAGMATVRALAG